MTLIINDGLSGEQTEGNPNEPNCSKETTPSSDIKNRVNQQISNHSHKNAMSIQDYMSVEDLYHLHFFRKYQKFNIENDINHSRVTKRLKFTKEEDELLKKLVLSFGAKNWAIIASMMPSRTPRQCRDRYANYLVPGFIDKEWTNHEDKIIIENYTKFGPQWALISSFVQGRSPNSVKNRWKYHISKNIKIIPPKNVNKRKMRRKRCSSHSLYKNNTNRNKGIQMPPKVQPQNPMVNQIENPKKSSIVSDSKDKEDNHKKIEIDDFLNEDYIFGKESSLFNEETDLFQFSIFENDQYFF